MKEELLRTAMLLTDYVYTYQVDGKTYKITGMRSYRSRCQDCYRLRYRRRHAAK